MGKAATEITKKTSSSKRKKEVSPEQLKKKDDAAKHINKPLVEKAVAALVKYHNEQAMKKGERSALPLLGNDSSIQVQFGLEVPPGKHSPKPVRITIPHPIHKVTSTKGGDNDFEGLEEVDVCLIVKDASKPWVQEMINEFKDHMGCVKKVLGLESLRKKHSLYHQRRELLHKYDIFMADDRILPMLTSALGKDFIKAKKLPVPIAITRKEALPLAIQRNLAATYLTISPGTSISVRAGNTGMPLKKLVENVVAIAENAVDKIPRKWANIRNIAIKTPESTSLPFYNKTPEELLQIAEMAGVRPAFKDIPEDDNKDGKEDDTDEKRRKLATKSPLVRALKKQKKQNEDNQRKETSEEEEKDEIASEKKDKDKTAKKVKAKSTKEKEVANNAKAEKEEQKNKKRRKESLDESESEKKVSSSKKSKSEENDAKDGDYIASKKFKGSKKGYVFRIGKQGLGYYKDVKPVVDKMVLQALLRSREQAQGNKRGRSKSAGKRKGKR